MLGRRDWRGPHSGFESGDNIDAKLQSMLNPRSCERLCIKALLAYEREFDAILGEVYLKRRCYESSPGILVYGENLVHDHDGQQNLFQVRYDQILLPHRTFCLDLVSLLTLARISHFFLSVSTLVTANSSSPYSSIHHNRSICA